MRVFVFYFGLILLVLGLAHPLGIVDSDIFKYILYVGIIAFGVGVLLLPNKEYKWMNFGKSSIFEKRRYEVTRCSRDLKRLKVLS